MRNEILIAGSGGQGVISTSVILSKALGIYNGYEVAQTQSYGPEARGGACKAGVVYSNEEIDYMLTCMDQLADEDQELLQLRYLSEYTYEEMAEITGKKINALQVAVHRALNKLRDIANNAS